MERDATLASAEPGSRLQRRQLVSHSDRIPASPAAYYLTINNPEKFRCNVLGDEDRFILVGIDFELLTRIWSAAVVVIDENGIYPIRAAPLGLERAGVVTPEFKAVLFDELVYGFWLGFNERRCCLHGSVNGCWQTVK
jgi:hypothetical protein